MVKHTQTIRPQFADELFECVWLFCEIGAERVKTDWKKQIISNLCNKYNDDKSDKLINRK